MKNNKIPFDYHLKKMFKSETPDKYAEHAEYFVRQNLIQLSFDIQEWYSNFYIQLNGLLDNNAK